MDMFCPLYKNLFIVLSLLLRDRDSCVFMVFVIDCCSISSINTLGRTLHTGSPRISLEYESKIKLPALSRVFCVLWRPFWIFNTRARSVRDLKPNLWNRPIDQSLLEAPTKWWNWNDGVLNFLLVRGEIYVVICLRLLPLWEEETLSSKYRSSFSPNIQKACNILALF